MPMAMGLDLALPLQGDSGLARTRRARDLWHGTAREYLARPGRQGPARPGHLLSLKEKVVKQITKKNNNKKSKNGSTFS